MQMHTYSQPLEVPISSTRLVYTYSQPLEEATFITGGAERSGTLG